MKLNDAAREFIGNGVDATLVTLNPDGSPQVSLVWVALRSTPDGDELVTAHLAEHKKVRNIRRDSRVAVTIVSPDDPGKSDAALSGHQRDRLHRRGRRSRTAEDSGADAVGPECVSAGGLSAGIRHAHPRREGRRNRALGLAPRA